MNNTVRKVGWIVGDPPRALELLLTDVRRALNLSYWDAFTTTTALTATPAEIWSDTLPSNSVWDVEMIVTGYATDGSAAGYRRVARVKRATGAAALMGTDTIGTDREDIAVWNVTVSVSGNDVSLSVTGDATRTVSWKALIRILEVR